MADPVIGGGDASLELEAPSNIYREVDRLEVTDSFNITEVSERHIKLDAVGDLTVYDPQEGGKVQGKVENIETDHALKSTWDSNNERLVQELDDDPKLSLRGDLNVPGDLEVDQVKPDDNSTISFNSTKLKDLTDPTDAQDAVTKSWANGQFVTSDTDTRVDIELDDNDDGTASVLEYDATDYRVIADSTMNITDASGGSGDAHMKFAVDESNINHNSLLNSNDDDAHHIRPSAGTLLSEDASENFNVQEGSITLENLRTGSTTAGDVAQADGANGLTMGSLAHSDLSSIASDDHHTKPTTGTGLNGTNTFNVDDPLTLGVVETTDHLDTDKIVGRTGATITYEGDSGGNVTLSGVSKITNGSATFNLGGSKISTTLDNKLSVSGGVVTSNGSNIVSDGFVEGAKVPSGMAKVATTSSSASISAQQGSNINSATRDGEGLYDIDHAYSGTISAQATVESTTSSNSYPEDSVYAHVSYYNGGLKVQVTRVAWDSNNDVLQVENFDPDSVTITIWAT